MKRQNVILCREQNQHKRNKIAGEEQQPPNTWTAKKKTAKCEALTATRNWGASGSVVAAGG